MDVIQCRVRKVVCGVIYDLNKDIVLFIKILKVLHHCLFVGVLILFLSHAHMLAFMLNLRVVSLHKMVLQFLCVTLQN